MAKRRTVITKAAFRLLHGLAGEQRRRALAAIAYLEGDPEPDGERQVKLPELFPHLPGSCEAIRLGVAVVYRFTADELVILGVRALW